MRRSQRDHLLQPDTFWWAVGIEDSFLPTPLPRTGRTLDEYALTDHYGRWREDIDLMAGLGVRTVRYGIPWHRISPSPGQWEWTWADRPIERLLAAGIHPIVDLVHYGTPAWIEGAWANPSLPEHMAEYAARAAERFGGRVHLWTPLNEPRITAWGCGMSGVWPPYRRGWRGFVAVLLAVCWGIVLAGENLRAADPENVLVPIDAANRWLPPHPAEPALMAATEFRRDLMFLALDLLAGQVDTAHRLWPWLLRHGATEGGLAWFRERPVTPDILGINLYPMLSQKQWVRTASGRARLRFPYGSAETVEQIITDYWERYRRPMLIGETAGRGSVARRLAWLRESTEGVRRLRARGIPLIGYTWWPMYDLVAWAYQHSQAPLGRFVVPMGLWGLDPDTLDRTPTPLVDAYRDLARSGAEAAGPLAVAPPGSTP